jgi:hypothetical protein
MVAVVTLDRTSTILLSVDMRVSPAYCAADDEGTGSLPL